MKESDLTDRVALVTGAGGGLGRAACAAFARSGARVVAVDVDAGAAEEAADLARVAGVQAVAARADVSQTADVKAYVKLALDTFGRIDCFFNNAGIEGRMAPIAEFDEDVWDRVMAVNVRGAFLGLRHVLPVMIAQGRGAVVNTASVAGTVGAPRLGAYSTSKHAIIGLTRTAAGEVGRQGVRVNAVCPGPINTRMMRSIEAMSNPGDPDGIARANAGRNPMGRYGEADEVARVVVFLCSDAAAYVNGAAWVIDGGRTSV